MSLLFVLFFLLNDDVCTFSFIHVLMHSSSSFVRHAQCAVRHVHVVVVVVVPSVIHHPQDKKSDKNNC